MYQGKDRVWYKTREEQAAADARYEQNRLLKEQNDLIRKQQRDAERMQRENTERLLNGGLTNGELFILEILNTALNAAVERFGEKKVSKIIRLIIFVLVVGALGFIDRYCGEGPALTILFIGIIILVARWVFNLKEKNKVIARICLIFGIALIVVDFLPLKVLNKVIPSICPHMVTVYGGGNPYYNGDGISMDGEMFIQESEQLPITSIEINNGWVSMSWSSRRETYNIKFNPYEFCKQNGLYDSNLWEYSDWEGASYAVASVSLSKIVEDYEHDRLFTSD